MKRQLLMSALSALLVFGAVHLPAQAMSAQDTVFSTPQTEFSALSSEPLTLPKQELISFSAAAAMDHGTTIFGLPVNEGPIDRVIRGVVAVGLIGTGIYGLSTNAFGANTAAISWSMIGVGVIPTATAATGYCPLYQLFGVDYTF